MKRFRSAILLLSVLVTASFAVAAPPAPVKTSQGMYDAALAAAKAGNYARAINLCGETLKAYPAASPVWATLARLLSEQERHSEAIFAARKAVALAPEYAPFRADLASFYLRGGKRGEAATNAQKALSLDAKNDVALTTLASCRLAERRYKEAIPLLTRLQDVRGGKDRAVSQTLIATHRQIGDKAGAMRSAKAFVAKNPRDTEAVVFVIYLALEYKDRVTAQNYVTKLDGIAPQSPLPDYYRGLLALSDAAKLPQERLQNGERFFQKAVNRAPNEPMLRAQLGYSQLGQDSREKFDAARTNLTAAVLYANHDPVARRGLALVAEKDKYWEDAAAQYEAILKITPNDHDSRRRYAGVLLYMDRKEEAYRQFYTLATLLPKDTKFLKELATFFFQEKQYAKARGAYEQALERDPNDADAMLGVAQTLVSEVRKKEARDAFERTLKADPKRETAYLLLAQLYIDDGADPEALQVLERLLVAVPGSNAGRWQLIERYELAGKDTEALREIAKLTLRQGDPNRTRYRLATGNLHLKRERWAEAAAEFERLVAEEPENPDIVVALADAYGKAGRKSDADTQYTNAVRAAEAILNNTPEDRDARAALIHARTAQNNLEAATLFLNKLDAKKIRTDGK
ncbi:MAG: tetratricopeptide repeat protein [Fibrella sp.]|nr:tetratricopeptide repeat protein [Armatimonadota bacterium]